MIVYKKNLKFYAGEYFKIILNYDIDAVEPFKCVNSDEEIVISSLKFRNYKIENIYQQPRNVILRIASGQFKTMLLRHLEDTVYFLL